MFVAKKIPSELEVAEPHINAEINSQKEFSQTRAESSSIVSQQEVWGESNVKEYSKPFRLDEKHDLEIEGKSLIDDDDQMHIVPLPKENRQHFL